MNNFVSLCLGLNVQERCVETNAFNKCRDHKSTLKNQLHEQEVRNDNVVAENARLLSHEKEQKHRQEEDLAMNDFMSLHLGLNVQERCIETNAFNKCRDHKSTLKNQLHEQENLLMKCEEHCINAIAHLEEEKVRCDRMSVVESCPDTFLPEDESDEEHELEDEEDERDM